MTRHNDTATLLHMLDYARTAGRLAEGRTRSDLDSNEMLRLALTRAVEVVGEAAGRISAETQRTNSNIPWAHIVSTRNRLIHGYDVVDLDILWDIITLDLPLLIEQLEAAVAGKSGESP